MDMLSYFHLLWSSCERVTHAGSLYISGATPESPHSSTSILVFIFWFHLNTALTLEFHSKSKQPYIVYSSAVVFRALGGEVLLKTRECRQDRNNVPSAWHVPAKVSAFLLAFRPSHDLDLSTSCWRICIVQNYQILQWFQTWEPSGDTTDAQVLQTCAKQVVCPHCISCI